MFSKPLSLLFCCLLLGGCGSEYVNKEIFGTVTVGDERVELGSARFVPIDGTPGPAGFSLIVDGEYRIKARGGMAPGRHRVEIKAKRKTGRRVRGMLYGEEGEIDETVPIGPTRYSGSKSPLVVEVTADSEGKFDLKLPSD